MNFEETLPLRFWINLGRRGDRRAETEVRLDEAGVTAERFSAIDASGIPVSATTARMVQETGPDGMIRWQITKSPRGEVRGYEGAGRYALALTQRLALREARRRGAPAVLLLEDDVVFHPNFQALVSAVDLPDDWGIFYLGCTHNRRPSWAGTRVVRCDYAVDTHAIAVRAPYYGRVMEMLDRHLKPDLGVAKASDQFLALLHQEIPSYACYPNLAWQDVSASDLTNHVYSNYTKDGRQKNWQESVVTLLPEITNPPSSSKEETIRTSAKNQGFPRTTCSSRETRLGLLFLTRGDVNNPEIWREFVAEMPDRVEIFSHPKHPKELIGGFLEGTAIQKLIPTQWGDISLVRAAREMLLAALEDPSLTHFALLSESCVPMCPDQAPARNHPPAASGSPPAIRVQDPERSQFAQGHADRRCARSARRLLAFHFPMVAARQSLRDFRGGTGLHSAFREDGRARRRLFCHRDGHAGISSRRGGAQQGFDLDLVGERCRKPELVGEDSQGSTGKNAALWSDLRPEVSETGRYRRLRASSFRGPRTGPSEYKDICL
jgi:hypothetical protein